MKGTSEAIAFLQKWQPKGPWNLTSILEGGRGPENKTFMPGGVRAMAEWIDTRNGKRNLYFTVNDTRSTQASKPKKEHMLRGRAFHVDIDPIKGADLGKEQRRIKGLIQSFPIAPTVVIFSGGGYQMFWKFKDRVPLKNGTIEDIEDTNRKIERLLVGTTQCWNIDRIMRLPGTMNIPNKTKRKAGRKPVMAKVVRADWGKAHTVKQFEDLPALPEKTAPWLGPLLLTGERPDKDYPSRSEASMAAVGELKRSGVDKDDAYDIMTDTNFEISGHITDATNPERAFDRQWDKAEGPNKSAANWDDIIYIDDQEKFYHVRTHVSQTPHWFNDIYVAFKVAAVKDVQASRTPTQYFLETFSEKRFDKLTWNPYLESGAVEHRGIRLYNTWKTPDNFGKKGDVKPWLWIIRNVFGDKAELVIKRMAFDVQYPHMRPQWHIFVTGGQGVGKSDSFYPLMRWFGEWDMARDVNSHTLKSEFNSYLTNTKMVIAEDVGGLTGAVFNEMKTVMAGGAQTIQVNEKNEKRRSVAIVASFYMAANPKNAISLSKLERRLLVHHSKAVSPQKDESLKPDAIRRHNWLVKNWWNVIWYLKNEVEVDENFCSVLPAQSNKDLLETVSLTAPIHERIEEYLEEFLETNQLFTLKEVEHYLDNNDIGIDKNQVNQGLVQRALLQLNCDRCYGGRSVKVKNGGGHLEQMRFWSRDKDLQIAKPETLRMVWDARVFLQDEDE